METHGERIAVVGLGAILPDAPDAAAFWSNVKDGRYSISEVPVGRWDPDLYYDPDPKAPDKTYSKIGGWVKEWDWDPLAWRLPIPPRVGNEMDEGQKWAVACTRAALLDYGYPERPLDPERTAVIIGNAMAGEKHYLTAFRIMFPELAEDLLAAPNFMALPQDVQAAILSELQTGIGKRFPEITEDTMPGELSNVLAGRVANLYNFRGPNFTTDAACASGLAAMSAAVQGLRAHEYDSVITGGIDRNMGVFAFVKFCKIGALSATGTRPYADGADGFVMGEGAALFLLKRLADAERDGDTIYAVIRSLAGSSDGKGKGITAPNPIGQRLAIERAWRAAGVSPETATLIEGHGTSTTVGDAVELDSLRAAFGSVDISRGAIALGSVKSNIGHLKSAAGAAGILKTIYALHEKVLPPSINFDRPNPGFDWNDSPFRVNTELRGWDRPAGGIRRAGVSAFGFGGTNFHAVLEEYVPGSDDEDGRRVVSVPVTRVAATEAIAPSAKAPLRGALVIGAATAEALAERLATVKAEADAGRMPEHAAPSAADLSATERLAIDYVDASDLAAKADAATKALAAASPAVWKALRARGIFRGSGPAPKVAFLYTGQGSQYVNMLQGLQKSEPVVGQVFDEADRVMTPLLGKPLSDYIFVDSGDPAAVATAESDLMQTAITQPAVLATDLALTKLLGAYGVTPDMVMGHSLGEYGALVAAGALSFDAALEAVSARGREMTNVTVEDKGKMAAIVAPLLDIERIVAGIDGYVVVANVNSNSQAVIGGASDAVDRAVAAFRDAGFQAIPLPVSHAFHTSIVAPASGPLRDVLVRLKLQAPKIPIVANVTGDFYPMEGDVVPRMLDTLSAQVASPVQFSKGIRTLYEAGARVFVEVGPKKALAVFTDDVLADKPDVLALFTNHPKVGDLASFNQALCGLYASGLGAPDGAAPAPQPVAAAHASTGPAAAEIGTPARTGGELEALFAEFLERARELQARTPSEPAGGEHSVVITGAALGLPGAPHVFDGSNLGRILSGEQLIGAIPEKLRDAMLAKHITRLVKRDNGDPRFETIDDVNDVIKLAGRAGAFDLAEEFGVSAERLLALDRSTQLAIGAGIDALRDAGIPMVRKFRTTAKGTKLPEGWTLPEDLRDDTGVIFASAFPGLDSFADEIQRYVEDRARRERLAELQELRTASDGQRTQLVDDLDTKIEALRAEINDHPYEFDRRFLFKCLSMGHSQFAELVGARGPNTQVNSACASTTLALGLAEDWIRAGRCRRVVIVAGDDATSDHMMEWIGAGFLASGAAATDEVVEDAATPFDRRRHGMLVGMGAAAIVLEREDAPRERGMRPICTLLGAVTANSAFHGSRLDVEHITTVMESLIAGVEERWGLARADIARQLVFVSHETYTPARGGSAAAEVEALRHVFGSATDDIIVANTKGFTGHPMGVGIEDVVAVKSLETGLVPPVPNFKEVDPDLGTLHLSTGGSYPIRYALRLAAGFGSQISMSLLRWTPSPDGLRPAPEDATYASRVADEAAWNAWLSTISGEDTPELEVVQHALHVKARTAPAVEAPVEEPFAPVTLPVETVAVPVASEDEIRTTVLGLVAEKTGYPADMLELDLDLEADLGVDTVKQAEIFVALRETYGIPRDDTLKLRDFPTLEHVIRFVQERAGVAPPNPVSVVDVPSSPAPQQAPSAPSEADVRERVLALVAEKTGYPADMLELDLDLEADLGVDTVKQAEIFVALRETYGIPRDDTLKLRDFPTLEHVIGFVRERAAGVQRVIPPAILENPVEQPVVAAPAVSTGPSEEEVKARVLALVAEKTGYPADMLELDLDLEADLGVDTVKQAEIFVALRERYGIPRDDTLKLRDFPTLEHVIGFVRERAASAQPVARAERVDDAVTEPEQLSERALTGLDATDAVPRRVPVPVLRPPLERCKPTSARLEKGARVVVMADAAGVAKELSRRLEAIGVEPLLVDDSPAVEALSGRLDAWLGQGPISGLYWLVPLDRSQPLDSMDLTAWREALRVRAKLLFAGLKTLTARGAQPFVVAATRMGGVHGYDDAGASDPLGGAVTGLVKAYAREYPEALVKAVDFADGATADDIATAVVDETLKDPGAVEIGHRDGVRWSIGLAEQPAGAPAAGSVMGPGTIFVVTGAAGSIVSAIVSDLAAATSGTFHLLDLAPEPNPADPDLARFASDRDGLKRDLFERIKGRGERATPAAVERELAKLEREAAAVAAIDTIRASGGTARYHQVDMLDAEAVGRTVDRILSDSGRVDVLVHAAGLEISHLIPDKDQHEFDLVFDVKADGLFNMIHPLAARAPRAVVVFSSVAGRFGNAGQTDYSAANGLQCTVASSFRNNGSSTRGIAIDWTAWARIGMATRGSIPKMMELAGIDMLQPEAGIPVVRRELLGGTNGEVVIGGRLGTLLAENDDTGGVLPAGWEAPSGMLPWTPTAMTLHGGLTARVELDPKREPFLDHHRIDGTAVLPGVMGIEAFAEVASLALPGWHVEEIQDVEFLAPFKFYRDEPRSLSVEARFTREHDAVVARCRLLGVRALPNRTGPQVTTHFTGTVRLTRQPVSLGSSPPPVRTGTGIGNEDVYSIFFHGPAYRVLERVWPTSDRATGLFSDALPAEAGGPFTPIVEPRLLELCFQTAAAWDIAVRDRFALPMKVGALRIASERPRSGRLFAIAKRNTEDRIDAVVVDEAGRIAVELGGYESVELPGALDPSSRSVAVFHGAVT